MKKLLLLLFLTTVGYTTTAQVTLIPDAAFEQALINLEIDTDGIVNGQMATVDALGITSLTIVSPSPPGGSSDYIYDLTGLEVFINVDSLTINNTMAEELNVGTLVNLKYLNCADNMLTDIDVSNNTLLEYLNISSGGDVFPFNAFYEIDLSSNPNFKELDAWGGLNRIDLRNGNNNPDMRINISVIIINGPPGEGHTCIEVDDAEAAQGHSFPYSEWVVNHYNQFYSFVASCELATEDFSKNTITVYPNPASDVLHINNKTDVAVEKAVLFDISGRMVRQYEGISAEGLSVSGLEKGMYLLTMFSGKTTQAHKVIIE